jgi:transcriptional regulator NrdR
VLANARVLSRVLSEERGMRIVSGRTESHVFLVDLRAKNITGKEAEAALGAAHITVNKNAIPNDPQKPFVTSGIRIGSPAMTTRGFTEIESEQVAHLIADVLDAPGDENVLARVRADGVGAVQEVPGLWRDGRMKCPFCGADETTVADTRINDDGDIVRRRRRCLKCDKRFTTYERAELRMPQVIKKNGSRVNFDREKLAASLRWPCASDRSAPRRSRRRLPHRGKTAGARRARTGLGEVGEMVMRELKKLDKVAYVRFASVYRNFEDVDEFSKLIREVSRSPQPLGR